MELHELSDTEQLVLVGLVRIIVHVDQEVSSEETSVVQSLAGELGLETWNARIREARTRFVSSADTFALAKTLLRPDARQRIHEALLLVADSDEVNADEAMILDWVAEVWGLDAEHDDFAEDIDDQHTYDDHFVMLDED